MLSSLKDHPFAVEAFFERSTVLTYAAPKEELRALIPACLELDTFQDRWAFVAVAMVQTKGLRPKGFPEFLGRDFFLIGYRIFVRYTTREGKRLRGLYILGSQTDNRSMQFFGNLLTHYHYATVDISQQQDQEHYRVHSKQAGLSVICLQGDDALPLPGGSPFTSWKEARRFAGPLPFTFTFKPEEKEVLIVEGVRENWVAKPFAVKEASVAFVERLNLKDLRLANAFYIEQIPYHWKKGKKEQWKP